MEPLASYFLVIIIHFTVGVKEDLRITPPPDAEPLPSLDACNKAGEKAAHWLEQDFTHVSWDCVPVNKVS